MEVHSPGKPIHPIEKFNEFNVPPISRNPKIAYLFNQIHVVEELGFGMKELKKIADDQILPKPSFNMIGQYFVTTLYTKSETSLQPGEIEDKLKKLNPKERKGYNVIKVRGNITSSDYQKEMAISERTARYHFKKMVDLGLLCPKSSGKSIIYKINK